MTIDKLITPELREAWLTCRQFPKPSQLGHLVDAIRDLLAALLESEFEERHRIVVSHAGMPYCRGCYPEPELDRQHSFTWPDWQAAATKILERK